MRVLCPGAITMACVALVTFPLCLSAATADAQYRLGPQDKLNIRVGEWRASRADVYEWKLLNGEFIVDASGNLSLPLLGDVKAQGLTPAADISAIPAAPPLAAQSSLMITTCGVVKNNPLLLRSREDRHAQVRKRTGMLPAPSTVRQIRTLGTSR
jgi:Polysaccharide biosynthesis/export protein